MQQNHFVIDIGNNEHIHISSLQCLNCLPLLKQMEDFNIFKLLLIFSKSFGKEFLKTGNQMLLRPSLSGKGIGGFVEQKCLPIRI